VGLRAQRDIGGAVLPLFTGAYRLLRLGQTLNFVDAFNVLDFFGCSW
jgi:hypothetical protein